MEPAPPFIPPPAMVEDKGKQVVIRPPEVGSAHDTAVIGWILVFLFSLPWLIITTIIGGIGLFASPVCFYLGYCVTLPLSTTVPVFQAFIVFLEAFLANSWAMYLGVGGGGLIVTLLILAWIYSGTVRSINKGRYEKARNSTLFWGVLFTLPVFTIPFSPTLLYGLVIALVPAFFYLLTYGRLGEVIAKYGPVAVMGEAVPGAGGPGIPGPLAVPAGVVPGVPGMMPPGVPMAGPMPGSMPGPMPGMSGMPGFGGPPLQPSAPEVPRHPLCPTCGKELYYSGNHRRWYCMTCDNPGRR
ncbi:MAG TPA: hypothetical protein VEH56_01355 [Candidatus Saccharimonadales bacterium]|nr:hypothetical protein [Candidatus Saccharimonadales bacterium]